MRRSPLPVAILVALSAAVTTTLAAQQPPSPPPGGSVQPDKPCYPDCDPPPDYPPDIALTPTGTVTVQSPLLTVHWCDDVGLSVGSRWIKVNTQLRTGDFSWDAPDSGYSDCEWTAVTARSQSSVIALTPGNNTIEAYICDTGSHCTDRTWTIVYDDKPMPAVSLAPYRSDLIDYGRCAMSCFAATYAQSTVPYFTLDAPRAATLLYNSDLVTPQPFIFADVTHTGNQGNLPGSFYLKVQPPGRPLITFLNGEQTLRFTPGTATLRLSGQFDAAVNGMDTTGAYPVTIIVGADYGGTVKEVSLASRVLVVRGNSSPVARGWWIAGFQHLIVTPDGSVLLPEGDGSATYFQKSGTSYISPPGDFTRLTNNGGEGWTRAYPDSSKVYFDADGYVWSTADRLNNYTWFQWDASHRPWKIQDPTHTQNNVREITFVYDGYGLDYIQDAFGRQTQVSVDANHDLRTFTDPDGRSTSFSYTSGRLATVTDRAGATTTFGYHPQAGKVTSIRGPLARFFGESQDAQPVDSFIPWQMMTTPYTLTYPTFFTSMQASAVQATTVDPGSHIARFSVNGLGQPLWTGGPLGDTVTTSYNTMGQPTQVVDRLGETSSYVYDATGFATQSTTGGVVMNYRKHSKWTQPDSIWGQGPAQMLFLNSTNGQTDSVRIGGQHNQPDSLQALVRYTYDTRGRVLTAYDNNYPTHHLLQEHWYNGPEGNLSKDSLPTGLTITYGYDGYGRQTTVTPAGQPTRTVQYDAINRIINSWDGVNPSPTRYFFGDSLVGGVVTDSVMDPMGQVYRFTRNALGWLVRSKDPGGRVDSTQYDRDGLVRRTYNRRGQTVDVSYDQLHRVLSRTGPSITAATFAYSPDGRQDTATNAAARIVTYRNARQQPDSIRTTLTIVSDSARSYVQRYHYTPEAWPDQSWVTGAVTTLTRQYRYRGNLGVVDSLAFGNSGWVRVRYNADLRATVIRFSSLDSIARIYTDNHAVREIRTNGSWGLYGYDVLGRMDFTWNLWENREQWYHYDGLSRLDSAKYGYGDVCFNNSMSGYHCTLAALDSVHGNAFDAVGNRMDHGGSYASGNRIIGFNGCAYTTDATGNDSTRSNCGAENATFTWDGDGQLTGFTAGGTTVSFAYDPAGRLVRKDVNGTSQRYFLWDGATLVAELGTGGTTKIAEYMYYPGLDDLFAVAVNGSPYVAHTDPTGSVRGLSDPATGVVKRTYNYSEWGQLLATSSDNLPFSNADRARWKGALWMGPELDVYYMRNRWYEPRTGRFLSEDRIGLAGGINQFTFAGGNAISGADPTGLIMDVPDNTGGPSFAGREADIDAWSDWVAYEAAVLCGFKCAIQNYGLGKGREYDLIQGVANGTSIFTHIEVGASGKLPYSRIDCTTSLAGPVAGCEPNASTSGGVGYEFTFGIRYGGAEGPGRLYAAFDGEGPGFAVSSTRLTFSLGYSTSGPRIYLFGWHPNLLPHTAGGQPRCEPRGWGAEWATCND